MSLQIENPKIQDELSFLSMFNETCTAGRYLTGPNVLSTSNRLRKGVLSMPVSLDSSYPACATFLPFAYRTKSSLEQGSYDVTKQGRSNTYSYGQFSQRKVVERVIFLNFMTTLGKRGFYFL
jgi:hypothetical protein